MSLEFIKEAMESLSENLKELTKEVKMDLSGLNEKADFICGEENESSNDIARESDRAALGETESDDLDDGSENESEGADDGVLEKRRLTPEEKQEVKEKTGWSDKIVDHISSMQEAQVYMDAGLKEGTVNGRPALLNPKIHGSDMNANIWMAKENPEWKDWTNADLMGEGYPPRDDKGDAFELHHIGQDPDGPLAELTYDQHHSNGNFEKLHSNFEESKIDRQKFDKEKSEYWQARSNDFGDNPQG